MNAGPPELVNNELPTPPPVSGPTRYPACDTRAACDLHHSEQEVVNVCRTAARYARQAGKRSLAPEPPRHPGPADTSTSGMKYEKMNVKY